VAGSFVHPLLVALADTAWALCSSPVLREQRHISAGGPSPYREQAERRNVELLRLDSIHNLRFVAEGTERTVEGRCYLVLFVEDSCYLMLVV